MKVRNSFKDMERAYTLIELLIVIVTMALVFSVTVSNFRDFETRRSMDNAAELVTSDLRLAQEYARSGQKPQPPTYTCNALLGYSFYSPGPDSNTYYLSPVCSGPTTCSDPALAGSCTNRTLDDDISISSNNIRFNVLGRGALLENNATLNSTTITLTHTNGDTRVITVDKGGNIE